MMTSSPNERPVIPLETEDDQQVVTQVWKDREITGHPDAVAEMVQQLEKGERLAQLRRERWGGGGREGMARLCARFPGLQEADGVSPWCVHRLLAWSFSGAVTGGSSHALRFVLQVWNPRTNWQEVVEAVARKPSAPTRRWHEDGDGDAAKLAEAERRARAAGHKVKRTTNFGRVELEIEAPDQDELPLWNALQQFLTEIRRDLTTERELREDLRMERPRSSAGISAELLESATWERATESFKRFAPFNLADAWGCWDDEHRAAVIAWLEAPFNP